jgi:3-hydroxy-9,10-secoandrosta-1,3,5(10)-triene-9,17-dione monooxygenase reductase component
VGVVNEPARPPVSDPVISPEHYRATLGHFCSGITIVTAVGSDGPAGMTAQSFCALSLDPPLILVCPGKSSSSWPRIESAGTFCVNVLAEDQEELCRAFAAKGTDKFAGVGWSPGPFTGAPVLAGGLAWMECRMEQVLDGGDHAIVVGRVLDLQSREGRPLLFFRGGYGRFEV